MPRCIQEGCSSGAVRGDKMCSFHKQCAPLTERFASANNAERAEILQEVNELRTRHSTGNARPSAGRATVARIEEKKHTHTVVTENTGKDGSRTKRRETTTYTETVTCKLSAALESFRTRVARDLTTEFDGYKRAFPSIDLVSARSGLRHDDDLPLADCVANFDAALRALRGEICAQLPRLPVKPEPVWMVHERFEDRVAWLAACVAACRADKRLEGVGLAFEYVRDLHVMLARAHNCMELVNPLFRPPDSPRLVTRICYQMDFQDKDYGVHVRNVPTVMKVDANDPTPINDGDWRDPQMLLLALKTHLPNTLLLRNRDGEGAIRLVDDIVYGRFAELRNALVSAQIMMRFHSNNATWNEMFDARLVPQDTQLVRNRYKDMFCCERMLPPDCLVFFFCVGPLCAEVLLPKQFAAHACSAVNDFAKTKLIPTIVENFLRVDGLDRASLFVSDHLTVPAKLLEFGDFREVRTAQAREDEACRQRGLQAEKQLRLRNAKLQDACDIVGRQLHAGTRMS